MTILSFSNQVMQRWQDTGIGVTNISKPACQLVLALLFKGGSVMLHKTSAGMLQSGLLTLNIQTLDALERSHLFPNTLVRRAQPIIAASTSTLDVTTAQKSYEDQARIRFGSLRQGWDLCEVYFWWWSPDSPKYLIINPWSFGAVFPFIWFCFEGRIIIVLPVLY